MINESPEVGPVVIKQSPAFGKLALALAKAQGMMGAAKKDSTNPHFKSSYADLASAWDACREALSRNELAIVQFPEADGKKVSLRTMLLHSSGEYLEGTISATARADGPQEIGSVITYLRRYSLMAAVGIAPEDDDGNAGQGEQSAQNNQAKPNASPPKGNGKSTAQSEPVFNREATVAEITAHMKRAGIGKSEMESWTKIKDYPPTTASMTKDQLEHTLEYLKSHPDAV